MGDHLIVLHSAVRACAGYSRQDAPSILLDGSSVQRDTEHGRAITAQLTRRHGTLEEAIAAAEAEREQLVGRLQDRLSEETAA